MLARLLAAAAICCVLVVPVDAQQTKSSLSSLFTNSLPDNSVGTITPAVLRSVLNSMVNSWQQFGFVNSQTGTTYTVQVSDYGGLITFNNASPVAVSLPQASVSFATFNTFVSNLGAGTVTITPTTSTINGASTLILTQGQAAWIIADQSGNYQTIQSSNGGISAKTCPASQWFNAFSPASGFTCTQPAFTDISGTVGAAQLPNPSATTLGGVKSLASVTHNFLTSIGTNGTPTQAQPACADLSTATAYCSAAIGQLPGTATNDSATAGNIGEEIEGTLASGSATSLSTTTPKNITSLALTAGDWDVSGNCNYNGAGSVSITFVECSLSLSTGAVDQTPGRNSQLSMAAVVPAVTPAFSTPVGPMRFSVSTGTTVFLVSNQTFTVGTLTGWGIIRARRMR